MQTPSANLIYDINANADAFRLSIVFYNIFGIKFIFI